MNKNNDDQAGFTLKIHALSEELRQTNNAINPPEKTLTDHIAAVDSALAEVQRTLRRKAPPDVRIGQERRDYLEGYQTDQTVYGAKLEGRLTPAGKVTLR